MRYKSEKTMREIVEAIEDYFFTHKETPSITEIARAIGRSRSTVHAYLQEMSKLGQIHYDGVTLETPVTSKADSGYSLSPIIGSIACGEPQYEEENFEAYVALPDALFGPGEHFILRAKGESMIEAGIDPGDLVVVRKQNTADEGDIVVANRLFAGAKPNSETSTMSNELPVAFPSVSTASISLLARSMALLYSEYTTKLYRNRSSLLA